MINEFSSKVKSTNTKARTLFISTAAIAVILLVLSFIIDRFAGLVGNVGLVFVVVAILVYTKYISPEYYYDITHDSDGSSVFVVRMITGKRQSTLCRIGLAEIVKIERETRELRRAHTTPKDCVKYSYSPTLDPDEVVRLTTRSRYEKAEIIIEVNSEFETLLRSYVSEAHLIEQNEEE